MSKSKLICRWVMCAACFGSVSTFAQGQTTANRAGNAPAAAARGTQAPLYTPDELTAAVDFMKQHAPHRLSFSDSLRRPAARENFERSIVVQKRNFDRLQPDAPLYDVKLREFEINDDIFELCRQMKQFPRRAATFEPPLKTKVAELFDVGMKERQLRIDRLEKALADQRKAMETAEMNRDDLIAKNFSEISKTGVEGLRLNRNAPPNGAEEQFASPPEQKKK
jgi:CheY-like chemotaxis protein